MWRRFFIITIFAIFISACGDLLAPVASDDAPAETAATETGDAPTEAAPPTNAPVTSTPMSSATPVLAETLTPTITPSPIPTATLPPPDNAANCTNAARFIADVTIPDNSNLNPNEGFTKIWRVQNMGTCIWWEGYYIDHYSEENFNAPVYSPVPRTNPGEQADLAVNLVAPSYPGFFRGNFVIKNPAGLPMEIEGDSRLWLVINVLNTATEVLPTATTAATDTTGGTGGTGNVGGGGDTVLDHATCTFTLDDTRPEETLAAINAYRAQSGLAAYTMNPELAHAAQSHAADIACNQLYYHDGSDGSTVAMRVDAAGYAGTKVTENVYGSSPPLTPEETKEWWRLDQEDPYHNLNLVSTEYTEVGIGYAFYNNYGFYVVVFGQP